MAFRRTKNRAGIRGKEWNDWIEEHRSTLISIGIPPAIYLDEKHWGDFLQNGHLHWHPGGSDFEFTDLSSGQLAALYRFLELEYGRCETYLPLLQWLRARCGNVGR